MINRFNFALLALVILFTSCGSYKNIPYYQDLDKTKSSEEQISNYKPTVIANADVIGINVSSRTPEASAIFNYGAKDPQSALNGYVVDQKGEVQIPLIGAVKVAGFTTAQVQEKLNQLLLTYYKDPVSNVRILNFKIAVYGDVLKPDVYSIKDEKITITQALTMAGDLNITALRKNVVLVREEDGKRNFVTIDLTSKSIFNSPYYYLKNNDQIYVQPGKTKYATVETGYRTTSLILSGLSIVAIVIAATFR
ncbi:polysaccharide biosynthesis/export family protein [Pedobacter agri]|uniref:polysaccharide biosynthesis/export family protein n=1 Tax=Pedobacter agri TaxID=454586 RepID=UPI00122B3194|nr:polysaccharide biosynthesis/export family protein [Pedobacter agri]MDQ1141160.1 polysaccharide export outer membrane protein [Pedobacter agri]RZJ81390.1 MAG: polysaccharide export protein [Flavobacterium sp.]